MSPVCFDLCYPWYAFFTLLAIGTGACVGSYLNVCIYRIPRELSTVLPRSHCPHCEKMIPWYLNIPIVSWLALRGRCRFCGSRITIRYWLVELLTAALFLLVWLKWEAVSGARPLGLTAIQDWKLVPVYWLFVSGLILGTFVDFEHLIIPDRVTLGGIVVGLLLSVFVPSLHGQTHWLFGLVEGLVGAGVGWGLLWAVAVLGRFIFKKEAMGFGDVKLLGAIGAFLGWQAVLFTVVISSLLGSVVGLTFVLCGCKKLQSRIPYGPYLALAAVVWIFWGPHWVRWYVNLMSPAGGAVLAF